MTTISKTAVPGRGQSTLGTRVDATDVIAEVLWSRLFGRDHRAVRKARSTAEDVVVALRREGLITGTQAPDADGILDAVANYAAQFGEAPRRGISHLVAEALVLLDLPTVHRDVIGSLLPDVGTPNVKNTVKMQFSRALRKFHGWKWIDRGADGLITILDRDALVRWFTIAEDTDAYRAATSLNLAGAIQRMKATAESGGIDELRRQELLAMQRLMASAPGAATNERGTVRVVPRANVI